MEKIIKIHEANQYIVKDKVVFYGLEQEDPNKMTIWLEGGGVTTYSYPDAKAAKDALDSFNKKMTEIEQQVKEPAWKPSDGQIKVCKEVYADLLSAKGFDLGTINSELNRLEEELKKLKE